MANKTKYTQFRKLDKPDGKASVEGHSLRKRMSIAQSARAYAKRRGYTVKVLTEGGVVTITRVPVVGEVS